MGSSFIAKRPLKIGNLQNKYAILVQYSTRTFFTAYHSFCQSVVCCSSEKPLLTMYCFVGTLLEASS